MGDDTPEKDLPGRQVMEALGWEAGPEQLERDLEAFYHSFVAEGRQHTEAAFSAISEIALHHWHTAGRQEAEFGGLDPLSRIPVPWWILWALSTGWSEYIDAKGTVTLGKAHLSAPTAPELGE